MPPRIVVIGSANMDLVVRCQRIPGPGETLLGGRFLTLPGGKGANQAVAAARLGASVDFVGCVGDDVFGGMLRAEFGAAGIKQAYLRTDAATPTGVALIAVDDAGQNAILVAPGANHSLSPADVESARAAIEAADCVVAQLEIPMTTVLAACAAARAAGTPLILNPAPATAPLPDDIMRAASVLTPNEHEAAALLGIAATPAPDWRRAAAELLRCGPQAVVVTLGSEGCVVADGEGVRSHPALPVQPLDTTAAGDCFTGALAVALAEGRSIEEAARFASAAAAISVTRLGAQPSLPTRSEVLAMLVGRNTD